VRVSTIILYCVLVGALHKFVFNPVITWWAEWHPVGSDRYSDRDGGFFGTLYVYSSRLART
jgi:hypothetical protein